MTRLNARDFRADPEQPSAGDVLTDPQVTADLEDLLRDMDEGERRAQARIVAVQAWIDWLATPVGLTAMAVCWCLVLSVALYAKSTYSESARAVAVGERSR